MTANSDELFEKTHRLVTTDLAGDALRDNPDELAEMLRSEPGAVHSYVAYIVDTASLRWRFADRGQHEPTNEWQTRWRTSRRRLWAMSAAAATLAAMLLVTAAMFWLGRAQEDSMGGEPVAGEVTPPDSTDGGIATLTRLINVRWGSPEQSPKELSRLAVGQTIVIDSGQAEIIFDCGAEVVLVGPANFEIRAPLLTYSSQGTISARVGEKARGFTIETPTTRVTDLGTEFGVAIGESGDTEVAVFLGAVDLAYGENRKSAAANPDRLTQGEALRVGSDGRTKRVVSIDSDRFPVAGLIRPPIRRGTAVFGEVRDNIRGEQSKKFYRIVREGLREDSPAFVDRVHEWNGVDARGIPDELIGAEYIMPFNDDKFATDLQVTVTLLRPATLYVFLSDTVKPPAWLKKDFVDAGKKIGLDEGPNRFKPNLELAVGAGRSIDTVFSIWKREFHAPTTITLGAVERPNSTDGFNMYGIAAVGM